MNSFNLRQIPTRSFKPRDNGITMVMDKGMSLREVEDFLSVSSDYTDMVKLGFGTSFVSDKFLTEKISLYKVAGMGVYFGGTLFEAFIVRNQWDDYLRLLEKYSLEYVEVSDGSINLPHDIKCEMINKLSGGYKVLSEIGSKDPKKSFSPKVWIQLMEKELSAGSWKVIAEAREAGNVGLYHADGTVHQRLINRIKLRIPEEKIIWEAPQKSQQTYFIHLAGSNVNLGNISPNDVIPLETLRLGLRSDTFSLFLDETAKFITPKL